MSQKERNVKLEFVPPEAGNDDMPEGFDAWLSAPVVAFVSWMARAVPPRSEAHRALLLRVAASAEAYLRAG